MRKGRGGDDRRAHSLQPLSVESDAPVTVTIETVVVRDSEPVPATLDEQVVVLSVRAGACFGFNRVGGEIWDLLAEPRRVGEIFDVLASRYETDADTIGRDVTPFLQTLLERRLLRVVGPGHR